MHATSLDEHKGIMPSRRCQYQVTYSVIAFVQIEDGGGNSENSTKGFPGGPVAKAHVSTSGAWVLSLVEELRSHAKWKDLKSRKSKEIAPRCSLRVMEEWLCVLIIIESSHESILMLKFMNCTSK